jgi:hypothetical protein
MHTPKRGIKVVLFLVALNWSLTARASFEPIELTPESYNQDLVVEKTAPPPVITATTATMDQGVTNSGYAWFERGFLPEWPAAGLPEAGSLLTSDFLADHQFKMPASYQAPNAVLIDSTRTNAVLGFTTRTNCVALSFLTSSGVGRNLIHYTLRHLDGASETGTFTSPNWYNDGDPAWAANGRVNVSSFSHADLNSYNPRLYSADIGVSNIVSPITSIEFSLASGKGHTAIFAVSGAVFGGGAFSPLEVTGYSEDLVVEASAGKPGVLETNTTATMDSGTDNVRFTWYEQGYYPVDLDTGLPGAGSWVVSGAELDHRFRMPPSYSQPNAILIDNVCSNSTLTPAQPACYSALSFLSASASGPTTNRCIIDYLNGKSQTNTIVSPDWLGKSPAALVICGRVNVSTKLIESQPTNCPRLYSVDLPIAEQGSPVTHVRLSRMGPVSASHTVVFALAGAPVGIANRPVLSISRSSDGQLNIHSTQAGRLQSCAALNGAGTVWKDAAAISSELTITPVAGEGVHFYRVVAQ